MSLYGRLDNLPTEVVETIAYYAAALPAAQSAPLLGGHVLLSTLDPDLHHLPPVTPPTPSALVPLLCTSSRIYWKIRRQSCPRLYARIFRAKFDTSALSRRYGRTVLNAPVLATELVKRCRILKRIRHAVSVGRLLPGLEPVSPSAPPQTRMQAERELEENLWTAYLMMTENDGKNYQQLLWADVAGYNQLFYNQEIVPDLLRPTYPTETATRSLAFHLITLVQRAASLDKQDAREATERIFLLRPYVFAAHKVRFPLTINAIEAQDIDLYCLLVRCLLRPVERPAPTSPATALDDRHSITIPCTSTTGRNQHSLGGSARSLGTTEIQSHLPHPVLWTGTHNVPSRPDACGLHNVLPTSRARPEYN